MSDFGHIKNQYIEFWKVSGGEKVFKTKGTSMLPLIRESSSIGVEPLAQGEELKVGDIGLFNRSDCFIAHRIIGKVRKGNNLYYTEKGDHGLSVTIITRDQIVGKVVRIYTDKGTIYLRDPFWSIVNSVAGYYWQFLIESFNFVSRIKKQLLGSKTFPVISNAYSRLYSFLSKLPTLIFRHK
jgi:hypothetical protein